MSDGQFIDQCAEAVKALNTLTVRLDERVSTLLACQAENSRKIDAHTEQLHKNDLRLTKVEDQTEKTAKQWHSIVALGLQVISAVVIAFLLWKLHLK